ncbi:ATP-dependent DNA helicase [Pelosinus sp. sgz500959]|uniref:ATP-dependent DNA helicase n=1 Tax=Pelosinus sp. sgz500959 TaxID=3242472 RepID=UPI00366D368B
MRDMDWDWNHEKAQLRKKEMESAILIPTIHFFDHPEQFGLQDRQEQTMLSVDIAEAITMNQHVMVEAGIGIGKSFAYLIPALFAVKNLNQSVVIATASQVLAEQLIGDAEQVKILTGVRTPQITLLTEETADVTCDARIIITSQEFLMKNLLRKSIERQGFIKDNTMLYIIDEAHQLEEQARTALTERWTLKGIKKIEAALQKVIPRNPQRKEQIENLRKIGDYRRQFFSEAAEHIQHLQISKGKHGNSRKLWLPKKGIVNYTDWAKQLDNVIAAVPLEEQKDEILELPQFIRRLRQYTNSSYLVWLEGNLDDQNALSVCTAPKMMNNEIEKILFGQSIPVILISETLCTRQGTNKEMYRYYAESIGFPDDNREFFDVQPSLFDYEKNSIVYIPDDLPLSDEKSHHTVYLEAISDRIAELIILSQGKTLILFTDQKDLQDVYDLLKIKDLDYQLVRAEGPLQQEVVEEFKVSQGVLLAADPYWEEFSLSGFELSSLIIVQLPFPGFDPIIDYKISQADDAKEILFPEMLIKLRQGTGRLIQRETDSGALSILDARMSDALKYSYKEDILQALLIKNRVSQLHEVEKFLQKKVKK